MRFQKTTEYALRVMIYLAKNKNNRFSANKLHRELNIPYKYLGRLMSRLSAAGLVEVLSGKFGGYKIARTLDSIHLNEITDLIEGKDDYERCVLGFSVCSDENPCFLHSQWSKQRESMKNMLYNTSLADFDYNKISKL